MGPSHLPPAAASGGLQGPADGAGYPPGPPAQELDILKDLDATGQLIA
jgi:hypothetical protein